MINTKQAEY